MVMAMIVRTYEKLDLFIDRWLSGTIDLLIIESEGGLGKSHSVRQRLKGIPHLAINSYVTPLMNYKQLYYHKDKLVWYDDVDLLLTNGLQIALMKQVCETTSVKTLCYRTSSSLIEDIPMDFKTTSKVLITCNEISGDNIHLRAIKDRGFYVRFKPTREEILAKMREVTLNYRSLEDSEKEEVMSLIEYNVKNCKNLTLRSLVKGFQLYEYYKMKGADWKEDLLKELGLNENLVSMNELLAKYSKDIERLKHWKLSRQSFYKYKAMAEV